jgi:DNA-binding response OmpR family regulator
MVNNETPATILVADDDDDIRGVVCSTIESMGHIVVPARDGEHAMRLFEAAIPDLVLLDVTMPGMLGTEVCQKIKSRQEGALIPVMMLTARDTVDDKVEALGLGADDYLTKPFNPRELQARVRALLRIKNLNVQLIAAQQKIVDQERQLAVKQLAGGVAHELGQPVAAIMLNSYLLDQLPPTDEKFKGVITSIRADAKRLGELLQRLSTVDASKGEEYYGAEKVILLDKKPE